MSSDSVSTQVTAVGGNSVASKKSGVSIETARSIESSQQDAASNLDVLEEYDETMYEDVDDSPKGPETSSNVSSAIMIKIPTFNLSYLREEFMKALPLGLNLEEFLQAFVTNMSLESDEELLRIVPDLVDFFNLVDINGDGEMQWSEFVMFVIEQVGKYDNFLIYEKLGLVNRTEIQHAASRLTVKCCKFVPEINKLVLGIGNEIQFHETDETSPNWLRCIFSMKLQDKTKLAMKEDETAALLKGSDNERKSGGVRMRIDPKLASSISVMDLVYAPSVDLLILLRTDMRLEFLKLLSRSKVSAEVIIHGGFFDFTTSYAKIAVRDMLNEPLRFFCIGGSCTVDTWEFKVSKQTPVTVKNPLQMEKHTDFIRDILIIQNEMYNLIITGGLDKVVYMWDLVNLTYRTSRTGLSKGIECLAYDNKSILFAGGFDNQIVAWDLDAHINKPLFTLSGHSSAVLRIVAINACERAVTLDSAGEMILWDASKFSGTDKEGRRIDSVSYTNDHLRAFDIIPRKGGMFPTVNGLIIVANGRCQHIYKVADTLPKEAPPVCVIYSLNLLMVITVHPKEILFWSAITGEKISQINHALMCEDENKKKGGASASCEIFAAVMDDRDRKIYVGDSNGVVSVYNCLNCTKIKSFPALPFAVRLLIYSPDKTIIGVAGAGDLFVLDDMTPDDKLQDSLLREIKAHDTDVVAMTYSHHLGLIATADCEGTLMIWDYQYLSIELIIKKFMPTDIGQLVFVDPFPFLVITDSMHNFVAVPVGVAFKYFGRKLWRLKSAPKSNVRMTARKSILEHLMMTSGASPSIDLDDNPPTNTPAVAPTATSSPNTPKNGRQSMVDARRAMVRSTSKRVAADTDRAGAEGNASSAADGAHTPSSPKKLTFSEVPNSAMTDGNVAAEAGMIPSQTSGKFLGTLTTDSIDADGYPSSQGEEGIRRRKGNDAPTRIYSFKKMKRFLNKRSDVKCLVVRYENTTDGLFAADPGIPDVLTKLLEKKAKEKEAVEINPYADNVELPPWSKTTSQSPTNMPNEMPSLQLDGEDSFDPVAMGLKSARNTATPKSGRKKTPRNGEAVEGMTVIPDADLKKQKTDPMVDTDVLPPPNITPGTAKPLEPGPIAPGGTEHAESFINNKNNDDSWEHNSIFSEGSYDSTLGDESTLGGDLIDCGNLNIVCGNDDGTVAIFDFSAWLRELNIVPLLQHHYHHHHRVPNKRGYNPRRLVSMRTLRVSDINRVSYTDEDVMEGSHEGNVELSLVWDQHKAAVSSVRIVGDNNDILTSGDDNCVFMANSSGHPKALLTRGKVMDRLMKPHWVTPIDMRKREVQRRNTARLLIRALQLERSVKEVQIMFDPFSDDKPPEGWNSNESDMLSMTVAPFKSNLKTSSMNQSTATADSCDIPATSGSVQNESVFSVTSKVINGQLTLLGDSPFEDDRREALLGQLHGKITYQMSYQEQARIKLQKKATSNAAKLSPRKTAEGTAAGSSEKKTTKRESKKKKSPQKVKSGPAHYLSELLRGGEPKMEKKEPEIPYGHNKRSLKTRFEAEIDKMDAKDPHNWEVSSVNRQRELYRMMFQEFEKLKVMKNVEKILDVKLNALSPGKDFTKFAETLRKKPHLLGLSRSKSCSSGFGGSVTRSKSQLALTGSFDDNEAQGDINSPSSVVSRPAMGFSDGIELISESLSKIRFDDAAKTSSSQEVANADNGAAADHTKNAVEECKVGSIEYSYSQHDQPSVPASIERAVSMKSNDANSVNGEVNTIEENGTYCPFISFGDKGIASTSSSDINELSNVEGEPEGCIIAATRSFDSAPLAPPTLDLHAVMQKSQASAAAALKQEAAAQAENALRLSHQKTFSANSKSMQPSGSVAKTIKKSSYQSPQKHKVTQSNSKVIHSKTSGATATTSSILRTNSKNVLLPALSTPTKSSQRVNSVERSSSRGSNNSLAITTAEDGAMISNSIALSPLQSPLLSDRPKSVNQSADHHDSINKSNSRAAFDKSTSGDWWAVEELINGSAQKRASSPLDGTRSREKTPLWRPPSPPTDLPPVLQQNASNKQLVSLTATYGSRLTPIAAQLSPLAAKRSVPSFANQADEEKAYQAKVSTLHSWELFEKELKLTEKVYRNADRQRRKAKKQNKKRSSTNPLDQFAEDVKKVGGKRVLGGSFGPKLMLEKQMSIAGMLKIGEQKATAEKNVLRKIHYAMGEFGAITDTVTSLEQFLSHHDKMRADEFGVPNDPTAYGRQAGEAAALKNEELRALADIQGSYDSADEDDNDDITDEKIKLRRFKPQDKDKQQNKPVLKVVDLLTHPMIKMRPQFELALLRLLGHKQKGGLIGPEEVTVSLAELLFHLGPYMSHTERLNSSKFLKDKFEEEALRLKEEYSSVSVEQRQILRSLFKFFDVDGSGSIEASEILAVMKKTLENRQKEAAELIKLGYYEFGTGEIDESMVERMIAEVDMDGNKALDFEEFVELFKDTAPQKGYDSNPF